MAVYRVIICNTLGLFALALDITAFFLLVNTVMLVKPMAWLVPFHHAGKALVDSYTELVNRCWRRFHHRSLSPVGARLIGLALLELAKVVLLSVAAVP